MNRSVLAFPLGFILLSSCSQHEEPFQQTARHLFSLLDPEQTQVQFSNTIKEDGQLNYMFYQSIYNGAGVGIGDLDGDGLEDIFFAGNQVPDRLYKNLGDMKFEDITQTAGILADEGWSTGVAIADVNGDGHQDIYVSRFLLEDEGLRRNLLYINNGDMTFTEQSERWGVGDHGYSIQAAFLDFDKDGDLDLYCVNQPPNHSSRRIALKGKKDMQFTDKLYRNEGDHFVEVTEEAGITNYAYGLSAIVSDLNEDGWPDIYVTCDFDEPDMVFINQKDGRFKDEASSYLQHMSNFSMGADIADFNNDGLMDIFTADMVAEDNKRLKTNMSGMNPEKFWTLVDSGYHHQYMFNALQVNRGQGHFSEIAQLSGISATDWSWSTLFSDLDQDGDKDLIITNGLKRDVRDNDFNIMRRKKVRELEEKARSEGKESISINPLDLLALSPSTPIGNYFYENNGALQFDKAMEKWGVDHKMISQGAALADLDNDGDLDLIFNNMDEAASIYKNQREAYVDHHWLGIVLDEEASLGTRVSISTASGSQVLECRPVTGYMSTSTARLVFGLGKDDTVHTMTVTWPDGTAEIWNNIAADQYLSITKGSGSPVKRERSSPSGLYTETDLIEFLHHENEFDDFETEILIPHRMSTVGPCLCKGDLNGDELEDIYIGGAKGQSGVIYFQDGQDGFSSAVEIGDKRYEDTGCAIFDSNGDGLNDLYVVSGGNEERNDLSAYQDRLYVNQGSGKLKRSASALPAIRTSGKVVRAADIDSDGDMDLFVGGRQVPGKYPYPTDSHILINSNGSFSDQTEALAPALKAIGMVTDALWHDRDQDGDLDLTLVGEWMPITFLENEAGQWRISSRVKNSVGWWNTIAASDLDGDGDEDYILGNLGLNIKYKASPEEPFQIFSADFDKNGSNDIYMAYYQEGNCFPVRGRQCSSQQLPFVKEKFPTYNEFSEASVYDVLGEDTAGALNYQAEIFESIFLWNEGDTYRMEALPIEAQFSVVNTIIIDDLDNDGSTDIYLAGNLFDREVETTRSDASYGVFLQQNAPGSYESRPLDELGFYAGYNVRDMVKISGKKKDLIIMVVNDDQVRIFAENQVSE